VIRTVNYELDDNGIASARDPAVASSNWIAELDHDLSIIKAEPIDEALIAQQAELFQAPLEDARLFRWKDA
jgi:hypothetical protein